MNGNAERLGQNNSHKMANALLSEKWTSKEKLVRDGYLNLANLFAGIFTTLKGGFFFFKITAPNLRCRKIDTSTYIF